MKRKLKVTITKIQRKRNSLVTLPGWFYCPICRDLVETLTSVELKLLFNLTEQTLDSLVSNEIVHTIMIKDGDLSICRNSLLKLSINKILK